MGTKKSSAAQPDKRVHRFIVKKNIMGEYSAELEKQFTEELSKINCPVILDLTTTTIIDSRGIALCVGLYKECRRKEISFSIEASPELCRFFKLLKLDRILQFTEKGSGT
jgi:anti-anti-sigma factor